MIIAEIGHNHNGNINLAATMIEEAKECGADIAKFQLYDIDKIKKPWQSRYMELMAAELDFKQALTLAQYCDKVGIEFMASVFDTERVRWCEDLGVKRYKIASRSIYDEELWTAVLKTGKPIIASLGKWKGDKLPEYPAEYLYCISDYPAQVDREKFPKDFTVYSGFSDHTLGLEWAKEALNRGARIIEKHFTLSKSLPGYNQAGSCEPHELKELVNYGKQYNDLLLRS